MEYSKQYDFKVTQVDAFKLNGISVSSTKIRNLIKEGNIDEANRFLGIICFFQELLWLEEEEKKWDSLLQIFFWKN